MALRPSAPERLAELLKTFDSKHVHVRSWEEHGRLVYRLYNRKTGSSCCVSLRGKMEVQIWAYGEYHWLGFEDMHGAGGLAVAVAHNLGEPSHELPPIPPWWMTFTWFRVIPWLRDRYGLGNSQKGSR